MTSCQNICDCISDSLTDVISVAEQEYQSQCLPPKTPQPNPLPVHKACCNNTSRECGQQLKHLQNKWTIRHTRGNVLDWWDRVTLEHETISPGCGRRPRCGELVTITYVTKQIDGMSLDWSRRPYSFTVGDPSVMKGLNTLITRLHKGETAKLYIPSEFAYGWSGVEGMIKPHTDLIMKVTLKKITR